MKNISQKKTAASKKKGSNYKKEIRGIPMMTAYYDTIDVMFNLK